MENVSDVSFQGHLQQLDYLYAIDNLPAMIFLGIMMLLGCVGNSLVFFVYLNKMKPSTTRCFILALSLLDLITCSICIPIEIVDISCNYSFGAFGVIPCKLSAMLVTFTSYAAGNILIAVGAVRHKKICYPTGPQTTVNAAKVAILLSCLAAFVFAMPSAILYGGQTTETVIKGVNGSLCTTSDKYVYTPYPLVNNGFQFLTFVSGIITLTTLYFRIWRKVSKFAEVKMWSWKYSNPSSNELDNVRKDNGFQTVDGNPETTLDSTAASSSVATEPISSHSERDKSLKRRCEVKKYPSKRLMSARRTTMMLFIITLTFLASYLPHLSLMATRAVHWDMIEGLTGPSLAAYNFFLRSYFINCALNPLIYSYCNTYVREEIKAICSCRFRR